MANQEHLEILDRGPLAWNDWRTRNPRTVPDLSGASLSASRQFHPCEDPFSNYLVDLNLRGANLRGCCFSDVLMARCDLSEADLSGADFSWSRLRQVSLQGCVLESTDFTRCDFEGMDADCTDLAATGGSS